MSLCFGLAAGSRPPLLATALLIVPVYQAVRDTRPHRSLLTALVGPCVVCLGLLLAYNYARFGNPLEVGQSYQLAGPGHNPKTVRYGRVAWVLPNLWQYGIAPPRPLISFPFVALTPPPVTYPLGYPSGYLPPEITGGLLSMTPLLLFALALPWLRRRRPQTVEPLGTPMLFAAGAGLLAILFLSYELMSSTERYEVDFAALLLFASLTAWFALSLGPPGWKRRAVRVFGAVLALWGCLAGLAISFTGFQNLLFANHPGTFRALENATSPISTAIAMLAGRPILAGAEAPYVAKVSPIRLTSAGAGAVHMALPAGTDARLTIVSPSRRKAAIVARMEPGPALRSRASLSVQVTDASREPHAYPIVSAGLIRLPVELNKGLNRVLLTPTATATNPLNAAVPSSRVLLIVPSLTVAGRA
jgi:hypothetical protein